MNSLTENLDAMSIKELRAFAVKANALGRYASNKARAQDLRLHGKIADALKVEALCEQIYSQLPHEIRW